MNLKIDQCCNCDKDCSSHHWMCDDLEFHDCVWCPDCWENTACCAGVHGEGCSTQVFSCGEKK